MFGHNIMKQRVGKGLRPKAPIDEWSHLPLPLVGSADCILCPDDEEHELGADWHHGNFPKKRLRETLGGMALRCCGMVHVPADVHMLFHREHIGAGGPQTFEEQLVAVTLAAAGYVPGEAVTYDSDGEVRRITLTPEQRIALVESGTARVPHAEALRPFFNAAISGSLSHSQQRAYMREIAAYGGDNESCMATILDASRTAFAGVQEKFGIAYNQGLLPRATHRDVGEFVCNLLVVRPEDGAVMPNAITLLHAAFITA